jgi:hypothetical protein
MKLFQDLLRKNITISWIFLLILNLFIQEKCFSQIPEKLPDSIKSGETLNNQDGHSNISRDSAGAITNENAQDGREDSIVFRQVPDSVVGLMKSDKAFAYANDPDYWKRVDRGEENGLVITFMKWLRKNAWAVKSLYILFGVILLVVIYMMVAKTFYSPSHSPGTDQHVIVVDEDPDFSNRIREAISASDFRNAIRYLYLRSIQLAGEKNLIRPNIQSTNQDYLNQMKIHPSGESFSILTDIYEKTCYGGFAISQDQFFLIKERFDQLFNSMAA